ncbi:hypothetical protein KKG46_05270 [Patescibacteria group bacterium]|nr:hypothetical protein [Patescibacteria group bacterium]
MQYQAENKSITESLYGKQRGPLSKVYFTTSRDLTDLCKVRFLHDGAPVIAVEPRFQNLSHLDPQDIQLVKDCKFENLADAFENQHRLSRRGEILHQAGLEFWSTLFPEIYRAMTFSKYLARGTANFGVMMIELDCINGVRVDCAFEALSFSLAYGYLAFLKALNYHTSEPQELQSSVELQSAQFGKNARVVFESCTYKVEYP